jgi:hypothetical protein
MIICTSAIICESKNIADEGEMDVNIIIHNLCVVILSETKIKT